ncbi:hypothetical protein GQ457_06G018990 [Hibiscus cannabinus]
MRAPCIEERQVLQSLGVPEGMQRRLVDVGGMSVVVSGGMRPHRRCQNQNHDTNTRIIEPTIYLGLGRFMATRLAKWVFEEGFKARQTGSMDATITVSNFAAVLPKETFKSSNKVQSSPLLGKFTTPSSHGPRSNPSMAAATAFAPATALVDERLSTEAAGLAFGLSNNLLGWILFGVFGLIWALYFIYVSSLEEDEESGLSL